MAYNIIRAKEEHFDEIIPLLFETGYYKYSALNNKLNLPPEEFHKLQTLKPYLNFMYVLINDKEVIGFYIALTKKQLDEIDKNTENWYYNDPELMKAKENITSYYYQESLEHDLIKLNAAIKPKYRGHGLYQIIKNHCDNLARKQKCTRVIFGVWRSNPANIIFKRYGAVYFGEIDCRFQSIQDQLLKGVFEVR